MVNFSDIDDSPVKSVTDATSPKNRQLPIRTPTPPRSAQRNRKTPLRSADRKMDIRKDIFGKIKKYQMYF